MNRINPLHIIVLLTVVILFLFWQLSHIKSEFHEEEQAYSKSEKIAKELRAYKKFYKDKKRVKKALNTILSQASLKDAHLKIIRKQTTLRVESKAITLHALNSLISKIFSGGYAIKKLDIKNVDTTHASLKMEIQW